MKETPPDYKAIPVSAAREIAEAYQKPIVVILGWDLEHEMLHVTTYGRNAEEKEIAANVGDLCARIICGEGFHLRQPFEDYRFLDEGERTLQIERLRKACTAAYHAIASIMAVRDGLTDECLQEVRDALQEAVK